MSLQQIYLRFLASPSAAALDPSASLHYITTTQSVESADAVVKHLFRESKQLNKRVEKTLSAVEAPDSLALEVETEIKFLSDGGYYLPALDDNFVADHVVTLPIIHFVKFEGGLVKQIRLHWDQGNMLKQLEVIGRSGRNWPIKDGKDQIKLISKSLSRISLNEPAQNGRASRSAEVSEAPSPKKPARSTSSHATRDPHASLHLYGTEDEPESLPAVTPRAQSAFRPPNRDLAAIVGKPDQEIPEVVSPPKARPAHAKYQTFQIGDDEDEEVPTPKQAQKVMNVHPKKYAHFEFGNGEEAEEPNVQAPKFRPQHAKHGSSWGFEDFTTPEKKPVKARKDDVRHFGWSDDDEEEVSPVKIQRKINPRKDAEAHFDFDQNTHDAPLASVSNNVPGVRRGNAPQFEIADSSPAHTATKKELAPDRKAAVKMMDSNWDIKDDSDDDGGFFAHLGPEEKKMGIRIAGNGQGQRKDLASHWSHDDEADEQAAKKENAQTIRSNNPGIRKATERSSGGFWDF